MLKLRSKFMLSTNVSSLPWRHAFTITLFVPLILNNITAISCTRELEFLTQLLRKLPEPNDITAADWARLARNYSAQNLGARGPPVLESQLTRDADFDSEDLRPTLVSYRAPSYGLARINYPLDSSTFSFEIIEQPSYQIYWVARSSHGARAIWRSVVDKVGSGMRHVCNGNLNDCPDIEVRARVELQKGYNFALSLAHEDDVFVLIMVLRRNDEHDVMLSLKRGLEVRIGPFLNVKYDVGDDSSMQAIYDATVVQNERPIVADNYAFFAVSTDSWNEPLMTKEIREHLCDEYRQTDVVDRDDDALAPPEVMSTAYWYIRRSFIPPENGPIRSCMMLIVLLRPIDEICFTIPKKSNVNLESNSTTDVPPPAEVSTVKLDNGIEE